MQDEAEERLGGPGAHARVLMRERRRKAEDEPLAVRPEMRRKSAAERHCD